MVLICPSDCHDLPAAKACTEFIVAENNPVDQVEFMNLRQSMNNGGGPACLRLRVVMNDEQVASIHQGVLFADELHESLRQWVAKHYRDSLAPDDLRDPKLIDETYSAFEALAQIIRLPLDVLADE